MAKKAVVELETQHVFTEVGRVSRKDLARIAGATHSYTGAGCSIHDHVSGAACKKSCYEWPNEPKIEAGAGA